MPTPDPYEFADLLEPDLKELYLQIVRDGRLNVDAEELEKAIVERNVERIVEIVTEAATKAGAEAAAAWRSVIEEIFGRTAESLASRLSSLFDFSFNLFDPGVLGEIDRMVARQVQVGGDTQLAIRDVVRGGWTDGMTVYNQGRVIRSMLGPTWNHSIAAAKYLEGMLDSGVPEDVAVRNYELYMNRLVNWRAEVVARTENIRAANAGRIATWRQMVADGILEQDRMWLRWCVTDDDRLCPLCAPMEGQEIPFGQASMFVSTQRGYPDEPERKPPNYPSIKPDPYGVQRDKEGRFLPVAKGLVPRGGPPVEVPYPPLHPNCRCDVRLILK